MKTRAFIFIVLVLLSYTAYLYAQERIDRPLPKIGTEIKGELTKATGWLLNPEGQWISRQNRIPVFLEHRFGGLIDYERYGLGLDNFISYQLREIKIQDNTYSILIKKYRDGEYRYPTIKEDWYSYISVLFYVFKTNELEKLKNIEPDSINLIRINILYEGLITWIDQRTYLSSIEKEIVKQVDKRKSDREHHLVLHIAPYKTKNIVQFQIYSASPPLYGKDHFISGIIKEHKVKDDSGRYSWEERQIYLTNDLFKHCYFETDYTLFRNFLKMD